VTLRTVSLRTVSLLITLASTFGAAAGDGDRRPLREARSQNDAYLLRIEPGRPQRDKAKPCTATLFESGRRGQADHPRWERPLVNDIAPSAAVIRDDGRFVVTLNEFRRGGARHALVIYGERGQLLRHFVLSDLLGREDWSHVKTSRRSIDWLDGAESRFEDPERFVIHLKWDREIAIDLKSLRVLRAEGQRGAADGGDGDIPPEILALLSGGGDDRAARLAALAEKMNTTPENVERLIAEGFINPEKLVELGDAAGDLEEEETADDAVAADQGDDTGTDKPGVDEHFIRESIAQDPAAAPTRSDPVVTEAPLAGSGIAVPAPDPANPVNYLDWLNAMSITAGPNAAPDIEAAIAAQQPWEGDQALFDAALAGDPEALASKEIQAWLDANRAALDHMKAATEKEFAGWQLQSQDGSMIGALLPALAPQRQLARTAVMDGKRLEASGEYAQAAERYLDTLAAGAQAGSGPTLIENLVGIAVQTLASDALLDLPAHAADGELDYVQLAQQAEQAYRPVRPMDESIQFERASMLDAIQRTFVADPATGEYRVNPEAAMSFMAMTADADFGDKVQTLAQVASLKYEDTLAQANAYYDALTEAVRLPYQDARGYLGELERNLEETAKNNIMIKTLTPALSRAHFIKTRAETQRRASLLVTNVLAYRQQHGVLPESLEAFAGREFVTDPFTGQRFAYLRDGDDFTLYSLGGNGADDGGVHDPKADANDVVYWPRPAKP
jgi:hypothetical protein